MAEYIEREKAYTLAKKICDAVNSGTRMIFLGRDILDWIDDLPAADVRPVKRGHWVKHMEEHTAVGYTSFTPIWSCSECALEYDPALAQRIHFCYNCGAEMEES